MTFDDLFKKWPELNNPKESGVEFYRYVEPDKEGNNLEVITSLEFNPGDRWWSGDDEDPNEVKTKIAKGYITVNFPYHARCIDFESVEEIDKHLEANNGRFKLPGYTYNEDVNKSVKEAVRDKIYDIVLNAAPQAVELEELVSGYKADWCEEDGNSLISKKQEEALENYVEALINVYFKNN